MTARSIPASTLTEHTEVTLALSKMMTSPECNPVWVKAQVVRAMKHISDLMGIIRSHEETEASLVAQLNERPSSQKTRR